MNAHNDFTLPPGGSETSVSEFPGSAPPAYHGQGPKPKAPFLRVDRWRKALPQEARTTIDVRDGEKGPLLIEIVKCRVRARTDRNRTDADETMVVIRTTDECGAVKHDYYLSSAGVETDRSEFARVAKAAHRNGHQRLQSHRFAARLPCCYTQLRSAMDPHPSRANEPDDSNAINLHAFLITSDITA